MKLLLVVLVTCIAWFMSARVTLRGRNPAAEVAAAAAMHAAAILLLAFLFPGWVWKTLVPLYLLLPHWVAPLLVMKQRERAEDEMVPFAGEAAGVPGEAAAAVAQRGEALWRAGFRYLGTWVEHRETLRIVRACYEHPDTREFATVSSLVSATTPPAGILVSRITVALDDGRKLRVSDQPAAAVPGMRAWHLPNVPQPERLLAVIRALRNTDYPLARTVPLYHPDETMEAFFRRETAEAYERAVRAGKYRRLDDGSYGHTFRGALLESIKLMFPIAQLGELRARARERALLRRLGLPLPGAVPPVRVSGRAAREAGALAVIAILLLPISDRLGGGGSAARTLAVSAGGGARPERLPADFSVPADYPGAVRALERLAGAPAVPLVVEDPETGAPVRTGAFAVPVPARRAAGLLDAAAPLFRARGFMLFRHEQTFGLGGAPETLALYPRYDPYGLMRMVGTNGANYDIGTDSVTHWLAALAREYPFTVVGIGPDQLEARFHRPLTPAQAADIAKRVYAFCPDVVDQGTETVRALEAEIRGTRTLYCWWD